MLSNSRSFSLCVLFSHLSLSLFVISVSLSVSFFVNLSLLLTLYPSLLILFSLSLFFLRQFFSLSQFRVRPIITSSPHAYIYILHTCHLVCSCTTHAKIWTRMYLESVFFPQLFLLFLSLPHSFILIFFVFSRSFILLRFLFFIQLIDVSWTCKDEINQGNRHLFYSVIKP